MAGKLVHFELPASRRGAAKGFWSGVFGWEFSDPGMAGMEYWMTRTGEDQGGAVYPAEEQARARSSTSTPTTSTPRSRRSASSAARRTTSSRSRTSAGSRTAPTPRATTFSLFQSDESVAG